MHHGGHLALHVRRRPEDRGRLVPARAVRRRVLPQGAHTPTVMPVGDIAKISEACNEGQIMAPRGLSPDGLPHCILPAELNRPAVYSNLGVQPGGLQTCIPAAA